MKAPTVRRMALADLMPAAYNPRTITRARRAALRASLERYGLASTLTWNQRTGRLVGGHQRAAILAEMGHTEADVTVVDLDPAQERALNIVLNSEETAGDFDPARLRTLIAEIADLDPDGARDLRLGDLLDDAAGDGAQDLAAQEVAKAIASEPERKAASATVAEVVQAIERHLQAAADRDPRALLDARSIAVPLRRGSTVVVSLDPDLADILAEIRRTGAEALLEARKKTDDSACNQQAQPLGSPAKGDTPCQRQARARAHSPKRRRR